MEYTLNHAKRLGVEVKPSTNPLKKLDVYKGGIKIAEIGGIRKNGIPYGDYPTYLQGEREGKYKRYTARIRQINYKKRHEKDRHVVGSNGWYSDQLLW